MAAQQDHGEVEVQVELQLPAHEPRRVAQQLDADVAVDGVHRLPRPLANHGRHTTSTTSTTSNTTTRTRTRTRGRANRGVRPMLRPRTGAAIHGGGRRRRRRPAREAAPGPVLDGGGRLHDRVHEAGLVHHL